MIRNVVNTRCSTGFIVPLTALVPGSYIRVRDVRTVTFIKRLEAMKKDPRVKGAQVRRDNTHERNTSLTLFFLAADRPHPLFPRKFPGGFSSVLFLRLCIASLRARHWHVTLQRRYCSIGMHEAAIEMFSELRMCVGLSVFVSLSLYPLCSVAMFFGCLAVVVKGLRRYKEAQKVAQDTPGVDVNALFRKQALWEQETGDKVRCVRTSCRRHHARLSVSASRPPPLSPSSLFPQGRCCPSVGCPGRVVPRCVQHGGRRHGRRPGPRPPPPPSTTIAVQLDYPTPSPASACC
jgi:hypothetical protein